MADAPKILGTDSLKQTYPKLNQAIDNSNEALNKSTTSETNSVAAVTTANEAKTKADSVQQQFNQVIIEGDSSVEAAQARVEEDGTVNATLKDRLDKKEKDFASQLEDIAINIKSFGKLGVGNDTEVFKSAFAYAFQNNHKLRIPKKDIPYELISNEEWDCPQIISDGAIINITGSLGFAISKNIELDNFTINTDDGGGAGVDTVGYRDTMFRPKTGTVEIEWAKIKNINIKGLVATDKRARSGITLPPCSKWLSVENVNTENVAMTLQVKGLSKNIKIRDVHGINSETLVWLGAFENAVVDNLSIKNTKEQSKWWIGKNTGTGSNGKDVLLTDIGGKGIKINKIKGEWCIERTIYCQSADVYVDNLESINTGAPKFVGGFNLGDPRVDNIYVGTTVIRRTDSDVLDSVGQIYGCENVYYDNIKIFSGDFALAPISISGNNCKITINNLERVGGSGSLFEFNGSSDTDEFNINNVFYKTSGTYDGESALMNFRAGTTGKIKMSAFPKVIIEIVNTTRFRSFITNGAAGIPSFLNLKVGDVQIIGARPSNSLGVFNINDLTNVSVKYLENDVDIPISYLSGSAFLTTSLVSSKEFKTKIINRSVANTVFEILINKKDNLSANILNYIENMSYKMSSSNDSSFVFPANNTTNWIIKIRSLVGGYAEFRLLNGSLVEVINSGANIVIGSSGVTPVSGKLTIFIDSNGYINYRNRIANDRFEIELTKLTLS
ncbi:hypothetical protein QNH20_19140 [Neobacillus sp. WH10]|uniref:hypothetical protein n=1 Tax=Neobacillus sp. WH10 TaxID=3047873 RepID=UPI0024C1B6BA|nr:hypothetical protein [Neobacillus sp. WH10]WHY76222.1 hypothetical protein QNH20_19140 [Neobacillus sp. WH10]